MRPTVRARCAALSVTVCVTRISLADPVLVLGVTLDRAPAPSALGPTASALGPDALSGDGLSRLLEARVGRALPEGDPLAASRQEVSAAVDAYFGRGGPREARRRLDAVIAVLERDRVALEARPENLAALVRALTMGARIDLEAREPAAARARFARIAEVDPGYAPDAREFPPAVLRAWRAARDESGARSPHGEIVVTVPLPGCAASLDGRPPSPDSPLRWTAAEGAHRVVVRCGALVSRAHPVALTAAQHTELAIDPRADLALDTSAPPRLDYRTDADASCADADAAALAALLGAPRAVLVRDGSLRVVTTDGRAAVSIDLHAPDALVQLSERIHAPPSPTSPTAPLPPAPNAGALPVAHTAAPAAPSAPSAPSSPWVAPWGVVGAGAALVGAGVVFLALREGELGDARALCPSAPDGSLACGAGAFSEASVHQSSAQTDTALSIAGFAVGGAAVAAGLLWYGLGRPSDPVPVRAWIHPSAVGVGLAAAF